MDNKYKNSSGIKLEHFNARLGIIIVCSWVTTKPDGMTDHLVRSRSVARNLQAI